MEEEAKDEYAVDDEYADDEDVEDDCANVEGANDGVYDGDPNDAFEKGADDDGYEEIDAAADDNGKDDDFEAYVGDIAAVSIDGDGDDGMKDLDFDLAGTVFVGDCVVFSGSSTCFNKSPDVCVIRGSAVGTGLHTLESLLLGLFTSKASSNH
jgi:hypothetical protein